MSKNFDLTPFMAPFLDLHMIGPLLDFLNNDVHLYDAKVITKEKIKVIEKTNMLELLEEEYLKFPNDPDLKKEFETLQQTIEDRKNEIFDQLDHPPAAVANVMSILENEELISQLKASQSLNLEYLTANYGITSEHLDQFYQYCKFKYDCGMYEIESSLQVYISLSQGSSYAILGALWGRLACLILTAKWDEALVAFAAVKDVIDSRSIAPIDQLRLRAWLLHWALFIFINQDNGVEALADLFMEKQYLQTIENLCPWLLRYYAAAVILSPIRRRSHLREVLQQISATSYLYSDPVTLFLESLFKNFDFDEAQIRLKECQDLIKRDFFLQVFAKKFTEEARVLICEMYCTINRRIDLAMLAEKLQFTEEEAERWMVDMIRGVSEGVGSTVDAKIDSAAKQVIMAPPSKTSYQQVAEKTRELTTRSEALNSNLGKIMPDQMTFIQHRRLPIS
jgi:translation initiation factor 3 subunit E